MTSAKDKIPIGVVIVKPGEDAKATVLPGAFEALQKAVGGYVEPIVLGHPEPHREIVAWVNEEGLLYALPWNRVLPDDTPLAGTIVVTATRLGADGRENCGLTIAEARRVIEFFDSECRRLPPEPSSVDECELISNRPSFQMITVDEPPGKAKA